MKKTVYGFFILALLVPPFGIAAQSRTTEFHKLKQKITVDQVMNIKLPDGYFLSGIVKNASGLPVKNAYVRAVNPDVGFGLGDTTDATGLFSYPVQKGSYSVIVDPPLSSSINPASFSRLLPKTVEGVSVSNDMDMGEINLQNGYILSGKVKPPAGTIGLFAGMLMAFPSNGPNTTFFAAQFGSGSDTMKYAMAVPAGSYKLLLIPLMVFSSAHQTIPMTFKTDKVTISQDALKTIKGPKGFKIWGTVKDTGNIALSGVLSVFQKINPYIKGMIIAEVTVMNGSYSGYLPAGNYTLVFLPYPPLNTGYKGKATKTSFSLTMPSSDKQLNLAAQNGVIFSGKVMDARNQIVKSADVGVIKSGGSASTKPADWIWYITSTDSKGQYRLPLPKDTYDVYAIPLSQTAAFAPMEIFRQSLIKLKMPLIDIPLQR